jgi:hypothetical protein
VYVLSKYGHVQEDVDGSRLVVDVHVYVGVDAIGPTPCPGTVWICPGTDRSRESTRNLAVRAWHVTC